MYYAIVTFGSPSRRYRKVHESLDSATAAACHLRGTGTCTTVRVQAHDTRAKAAAADISCGGAVKEY